MQLFYATIKLKNLSHVIMQQSLTAYKLIENLPKTSFIVKDRVLSINFIDSGNQFAQLICERKKNGKKHGL